MAIKWNEYELTIKLTRPMLGTIPKDREVYAKHVKHQLAGDDEEILVPEDVESAGWTGFLAHDGVPSIWDYQVKGFIKEAGNVLKAQAGVTALRSHIDNELFVSPRSIPVKLLPEPLERPIRVMTMQGPRVSVIRSDQAEADPDHPLVWWLRVLDGSKITRALLETILEYGSVKGLGQWRNGGWGSFEYELVDVVELPAEKARAK